MLFSFKIDKPTDIKSTFARLKEELESMNGRLEGDEQKGFISVLGTEGGYEVRDNYILITVTKKLSPLIPNKLIEKEIRGNFEKIRSVQP